uniref:GATA-type domain-containing protein n=1 Tax=Oryza meridionalis TaxID=40149 RepID=A0A0E0CUP3_9ORYZ
MRKPTPYVSLHDVVAFDDLVDGEGLCCPDDPLDEVMRCLSAVDDPFLAAFKLDCSPPTPAAAGDVDSKSEEHMHADVGGGDEKAGTPSTVVDDVPWLRASAVARKPRRPPAALRKRVWSLGSPQLAAATAAVDNNSRDEVSSGGGGGGGGEHYSRPTKRRRKCGEEKRCGHCQTTETPQWRVGPDGPSTLCNACGIRYRMDHLLPEYRPSTSPGFGSDGFSNRHRKVVKLREKKRKKAMLADTATAPTPGPV